MCWVFGTVFVCVGQTHVFSPGILLGNNDHVILGREHIRRKKASYLSDYLHIKDNIKTIIYFYHSLLEKKYVFDSHNMKLIVYKEDTRLRAGRVNNSGYIVDNRFWCEGISLNTIALLLKCSTKYHAVGRKDAYLFKDRGVIP